MANFSKETRQTQFFDRKKNNRLSRARLQNQTKKSKTYSKFVITRMFEFSHITPCIAAFNWIVLIEFAHLLLPR